MIIVNILFRRLRLKWFEPILCLIFRFSICVFCLSLSFSILCCFNFIAFLWCLIFPFSNEFSRICAREFKLIDRRQSFGESINWWQTKVFFFSVIFFLAVGTNTFVFCALTTTRRQCWCANFWLARRANS